MQLPPGTEAQLPPPLTDLEKRPVVTLGAGSIVRDAHAPAYRLLGLELAGIFDKNPDAAHRIQTEFGYGRLCASLGDAVALGEAENAVFDLALPPDAILDVLPALPKGAGVLIQKPLGKSLAEAQRIAQVCREKDFMVGVNFQLPFSPQIVAAFQALEHDTIGRLVAAEVVLELRTNWALWEFLLHEPRIEVLLHSIHYLSLFAHYLGEPESVASTQTGDPTHPVFEDRDICSDTLLVYPRGHEPPLEARVHCNHLSALPKEQWRSELVLVGERGRLVAKIADNLDYPNGVDDALVVALFGAESSVIPLAGNRFPWAFVATMTHLLRALRRGAPPHNGLDLGLLTMRLTETCYESNAQGGKALPVCPLP